MKILVAQKVLEKRQELLEEEHAMLNNEMKNNHNIVYVYSMSAGK